MYAAQQRNDADVVVCSFFFDLPSGVRVPFPLTTARRDLTGDLAARRTLDLVSMPTFAWNKLYRRELLIGGNIAFPKIYYEDVATTPKVLASARRVAVTRHCLYHYCVRGDGITGSFSERNADDYLTAIETVRDFIWETGKWPTWKRAYRRMLRHAQIQIIAQISAQRALTMRQRRMIIRHTRHTIDRLAQPPGSHPAPFLRAGREGLRSEVPTQNAGDGPHTGESTRLPRQFRVRPRADQHWGS